MRRRNTKPATPAYLERVAIWYLERYSGSEARLRRVLALRVRRSVDELGTDPREGAEAIEHAVERMRRFGYLDDARIARQRAKTLSRRGKSRRAIQADLVRRGIRGEAVDAALDEADHDELAAATALIRRRRLGKERDRDLATLARAGFSYGVARRALDRCALDRCALDRCALDRCAQREAAPETWRDDDRERRRGSGRGPIHDRDRAHVEHVAREVSE